MLKRPKGEGGTLAVLEHSSRILKGNPLGDPHVRKLGVWLPRQYDGSGKKRFPVLYDLVGFTGSGIAHAQALPCARVEEGEALGEETHCIMNLCMAATYDPDPRAPLGFRIPFNAESGELIEARWRNWRRHDPINLVTRYRDSLRSLRGIYIDCGWRDQYHIQYGSRILSRRLAQAGIRHRYEEFDDDHSNIDYRMDVSLPFLTRAPK